MQYPPFLKENGKIGFIAPSFGCSFEPYVSKFNAALDFFQSKGYYVNLGPNCFKGDGIGISTTPKACAEELTTSYVNQDCDVLIPTGGGELMCETILGVDFEKIKEAPPKWYMGYSDNTNFTFLSATMLDRAAIYGPSAGSFGMNPLHESLADALDLLTGRNLKVNSYDKYEIESLCDEQHPLEPYNCTEKVDIKAYIMSTGDKAKTGTAGDTARADVSDDIAKEGASGENTTKEVMLTEHSTFSGRLIGGCLDILKQLVGTPFDYVNQFNEKYKDDGIIWFMEACDLNVFDIRRALWQLDQAGWFKYVKGFIFGRPRNGADMMGLNHIDAVLPYTVEKYGVPVIIDADIGHVAPMMPIICGALSEVTYDNGQLVIDMGCEL